MNKCFGILILAVFFTIAAPLTASAQWDYNSHVIDNIIESRIDRRKTAKRIRGKSGKTAPRKNAAGNKKSSVLVKSNRAATALTTQIEFHRDTFQDFHLDDADGYVVTFTLTNALDKSVITKNHTYTYYDSVSDLTGVPAGVYIVKAYAMYKGRKYAARVGSEDGSVTNPTGGNFADSMQIEIKPGIDQWGTRVMKVFPETLHLRVIE